MGQREIIEILKREKEITDRYLSPKDIQQALKNIGKIIRLENIHKGIRKVRLYKDVEIKQINTFKKMYKLK